MTLNKWQFLMIAILLMKVVKIQFKEDEGTLI